MTVLPSVLFRHHLQLDLPDVRPGRVAPFEHASREPIAALLRHEAANGEHVHAGEGRGPTGARYALMSGIPPKWRHTTPSLGEKGLSNGASSVMSRLRGGRRRGSSPAHNGTAAESITHRRSRSCSRPPRQDIRVPGSEPDCGAGVLRGWAIHCRRRRASFRVSASSRCVCSRFFRGVEDVGFKCTRAGSEFAGIESLAGLLRNVGIDDWNADIDDRRSWKHGGLHERNEPYRSH